MFIPSVVYLILIVNVLITRRIQRPRPIQFFGEPIAWIESARYLAVILDTRFTWSAHINQVGTKEARSPP